MPRFVVLTTVYQWKIVAADDIEDAIEKAEETLTVVYNEDGSAVIHEIKERPIA